MLRAKHSYREGVHGERGVRMNIVAAMNKKGGVGKTITVANLGVALAEKGMRVLLVDFDPQGDLSRSFGVGPDDSAVRVEDLLAGAGSPESAAIVIPDIPGRGSLRLLAASPALRAQTHRLMDTQAGALSAALDAFNGDVDLCLMDTPAGENPFSAAALIACDDVLVPILPGFNEVNALGRVLDELEAEAERGGSPVGLLGVLFVNCDPRWKTLKEYRMHLREQDIDTFQTPVPRHQPVTDHARYGLPTIMLDPDSSVAMAYRTLAGDVALRLIAENRLELAA